MGVGESPVQRASLEFVAELSRWRVERGLSKKQLAAAMGFDPSYVSHVEARRHRPTEDFARRAETILQTGGTLWERFKRYDELRIGARLASRLSGSSDSWLPPGTGLVIDNEVARLSYVDGYFYGTVRRALYNAGTEPVIRYPVRIAVDKFPEHTERSNRHHRQSPLTWEELELSGICDGEPMVWRPKTERDAVKEAWLLFENAQGRFPLYPGQRTTIEYSFKVQEDKWGPYFQRAVRLPTRKLSIEISFPINVRPSVWGVKSSLSTESVPLHTAIAVGYTGENRVVYSWRTDNPTLHAWYRLGWRFRGESGMERSQPYTQVKADKTVTVNDGIAEDTHVEDSRSRSWSLPSRGHSSERMREAGIVQRGARSLRMPSRRFDFPREASMAVDVITRLSEALERVDVMYSFAKGIGLSAPQIGLNWAAAVIKPASDMNAMMTLLNPRIVAVSEEQDEQYEGCLSFFDVRGRVSRSLWIKVEREMPTGERIVDTYERGIARLVAHEIDHLEGRLYIDRLASDTKLIPLEEYKGSGQSWCY